MAINPKEFEVGIISNGDITASGALSASALSITSTAAANVVSIIVQKNEVFNYGIDGYVIFAAISQKLNLQYDLETSLHFIGRKETGNGFHRYFPDSFSDSSRWSECLYLGK